MSQVKGPVPLALRWSMVILTLEPFVTLVTLPAASAFSVFSPMSMFPPSMVRPHSLTTFLVISSSLMKLASAWLFDWTVRVVCESRVSFHDVKRCKPHHTVLLGVGTKKNHSFLFSSSHESHDIPSRPRLVPELPTALRTTPWPWAMASMAAPRNMRVEEGILMKWCEFKRDCECERLNVPE